MPALFISILHLLTTLVTFGIIRPKKSRFSAVLNAMHSIYDELHLLNDKAGCTRSLILKTENGGGVPRLGVSLFSSVLYEAYSGKGGSIRKSWQQERLDEEYVNMLLSVMANGQVRLVTADMAESRLKTLYTANDVEESMVFLLAVEETRLIYLTLNCCESDDTGTEHTPAHEEAMRAGVNRLKQIFDKNPSEL